MGTHTPCLSEGLITSAAALSITIGKGHTAKELETLGAFFTTLGDNLVLMALQAPEEDCSRNI